MDPNTPWIAFKNNPPNGSMTTLPWRWLWKTSLTSKYMGFSGSSLGDDSSLFEQLNQVEPGFFSTIPQKDRTVFSGCWTYRLPSGKHTKSYWSHGHWNSGFTQLQNGGSFHSYVSLPEGMFPPNLQFSSCCWDLMRMVELVAWFHGDTTNTTTNRIGKWRFIAGKTIGKP